MQTRERTWWPFYENGKRIKVDRKSAVVTSTNPGLEASIPSLLTLILVEEGFTHKAISLILGCSKSEVSDNMYELREIHHKNNPDLFRKVRDLGLDNLMAVRGLAIRVMDDEKKEKLLKQIDSATEVINTKLRLKSGIEPYKIFRNN